MKKSLKLLVATAVASLVVAGTALADFSPQFELKTSSTKVGENPTLDIHIEFDEEDEEIGNFKMTLPAGFDIAPDDAISNNEEIGGGKVTIEAGPACRPGPEGGIPLSAAVTINASIVEKDRTDEEADAGVHSVWFLDLEPANRVRLLVTGDIASGWTVEGAPTPSDNTCNPLTVDLKIEGKSAGDTPVITNPVKPGKKVILTEIFSQDSPEIAVFKTKFKYTK